MTPSRPIDFCLAAIVAFAMAAFVLIEGDALYIGLWYYLFVPFAILGLCAIIRPKPFFFFGASLALSITFISYLLINWGASRPDGLLGLGHLFSLPGALIGVLIAASISKRHVFVGSPLATIVGFLGVSLGFLSNQLLVCNTVMWCGPLSLSLK
jgi:hypothetical protein